MASLSSVCSTKNTLQHGSNQHKPAKHFFLMEISLKGFFRNIQILLVRTAISSLHILIGYLPVQATIEKLQLILIPSIAENPPMLDIIIRQIAIKSVSSSSWIITTPKLLQKYHLRPLFRNHYNH